MEVSGTSPDGEFRSALTAETFSAARAGDLTITTGQLTIEDGAQATVSSTGTGTAGNLNVTAREVRLNNQAQLTAETGESGAEGGANITLQVSDLLILSNESLISAQAFDTANGGNIDIDTKFLIAFPPQGPEGSDIIANASQGDGGKIDITAAGIFGIEFRENLTPLNDFNVSSEFGAAGEVQINGAFELSRELTELPEDVVDPAALIAQNPCTLGKDSEFLITGRGGLPPSPNQVLSSDSAQVGWVEPAPVESRGAQVLGSRGAGQSTSIQNPQSKIQNPIVPARGWVFNDKGEVLLVAYDPTNTGVQRPRQNPPACPAP